MAENGGNVCNGWKWLELAGICWNRLEVVSRMESGGISGTRNSMKLAYLGWNFLE